MHKLAIHYTRTNQSTECAMPKTCTQTCTRNLQQLELRLGGWALGSRVWNMGSVWKLQDHTCCIYSPFYRIVYTPSQSSLTSRTSVAVPEQGSEWLVHTLMGCSWPWRWRMARVSELQQVPKTIRSGTLLLVWIIHWFTLALVPVYVIMCIEVGTKATCLLVKMHYE